jgi:P27 family predicted phage terminase small subunit
VARGPQPKATSLRKLEGNPSKRRINKKEPQPTGAAARPDFVTGAAADEWDRATGAMPPSFYTAADVPVLTVYCLAWVMYRNALAQVAREGMTSNGSTGQKVAHPALAVAAKQAELILRAADRLGMTPAARTRLQMPEDAPASKFDGLLGGGLRVVK